MNQILNDVEGSAICSIIFGILVLIISLIESMIIRLGLTFMLTAGWFFTLYKFFQLINLWRKEYIMSKFKYKNNHKPFTPEWFDKEAANDNVFDHDEEFPRRVK